MTRIILLAYACEITYLFWISSIVFGAVDVQMGGCASTNNYYFGIFFQTNSFCFYIFFQTIFTSISNNILFKPIFYYWIVKIFNKNQFNITIQANLTVVDFLDVSLDLGTWKYKPFVKAGHLPMYVHDRSNHHPCVIK